LFRTHEILEEALENSCRVSVVWMRGAGIVSPSMTPTVILTNGRSQLVLTKAD
jgi:hypothetical protein